MLVHSRHDRELAVKSWLLVAAQDTGQAKAAWEKRNGIGLLRCGGIFSAVRIATDLVRAAAATENTAEVDDFLTEALHGAPVFMDQFSQWYYVLVPVSTGTRPEWRNARHAPKAEFLGTNCFLGVPRPDATKPQDGRSYWCVPMDGPGALAVPDVVSQLVTVGQIRQAAGERETDQHEGNPPHTPTE